VSYPGFPSLPPRWPGLCEKAVFIGGVTVTVAQAVRAAAVLDASRTSAIAPVLGKLGHPLAACDYFAAAAPYLPAQRLRAKTGRAGAAGRHVTKNAFIEAIAAAVAGAREADVAAVLRRFASDERYAAAMAASARARPPRTGRAVSGRPRKAA
jgi:hypothetical protein